MRRPILLALSFFALVSCVLPAEPADPTPRAEPTEPAREPEEVAAADTVKEDLFVPLGVFPSLEALCASQKELVRDRVSTATKQLDEIYGEPSNIVPSCKVSPFGPKVDVKLRAPFFEARALEVETGDASETHVVVRTANGWQALPEASITEAHNDPGCFSIERDTGIEAIRVEGSTLLVVEGSDRGARMEDPADETASPVMWSDVSTHVVACRLGPTPTCDPRVTVKVECVPSSTEGDRKTELRFATTYSVDPAGHVTPKQRLEDAEGASTGQ
jgi:hypothetical protein